MQASRIQAGLTSGARLLNACRFHIGFRNLAEQIIDAGHKQLVDVLLAGLLAPAADVKFQIEKLGRVLFLAELVIMADSQQPQHFGVGMKLGRYFEVRDGGVHGAVAEAYPAVAFGAQRLGNMPEIRRQLVDSLACLANQLVSPFGAAAAFDGEQGQAAKSPEQDLIRSQFAAIERIAERRRVAPGS